MVAPLTSAGDVASEESSGVESSIAALRRSTVRRNIREMSVLALKVSKGAFAVLLLDTVDARLKNVIAIIRIIHQCSGRHKTLDRKAPGQECLDEWRVGASGESACAARCCHGCVTSSCIRVRRTPGPVDWASPHQRHKTNRDRIQGRYVTCECRGVELGQRLRLAFGAPVGDVRQRRSDWRY